MTKMHAVYYTTHNLGSNITVTLTGINSLAPSGVMF